jgi:hypothetical protein
MSKMISELNRMSNREVVAAWNVMQALRRTLNGGAHENESLVSAELSQRGIPHQVGKRTVAK